MYAYIKGEIKKITKEYLVIENNNIGYIIYMSEKSLNQFNEGDTDIVIHTYQNVKEDEISLYGFTIIEEKHVFEKLITVSGIGVKTAINILSKIEPSEFVLAVITSDLVKLTSLPGVGKKSAQRIVLELQDKLEADNTVDIEKIELIDNEIYEELVSALQILGYTTKEIRKIEGKINKDLDIEEALKQALKILS